MRLLLPLGFSCILHTRAVLLLCKRRETVKEEGGQVVLVFWQLLQQLDCLKFFFLSLSLSLSSSPFISSFLISNFPPLRICSGLARLDLPWGWSVRNVSEHVVPVSLSLAHTHTHTFHSCYLLWQWKLSDIVRIVGYIGPFTRF